MIQLLYYLINLLNVYKPSRNLRSVTDPLGSTDKTVPLTLGISQYLANFPGTSSLSQFVRSPISHHLKLLLRLTCSPLFDVASPCHTDAGACLCLGMCDW